MSKPIMPADPGLVDHLVAHLISPLYLKDEVQLKKVCSGAGFFPETTENVVLAVRIERWSSVLASDAQWEETIRHHFFVLSNMLSEILNEKNIAVVAEVGYQMVCIINLRQSYDEFCWDMEHALPHMMEVLESEFDMSVTIAVSSAVHGLSGIPRGYREITDAFWYNDFLSKDQQILFYEALCDSSHPVIHSELTELDKKLISKLQMMDIAGIKYVLHEMIDREFIEATPTVKVLNIRLGGICCKILDVFDSLRAGIGDELYFQLDPAPRIAEARTLVDMTAAMDEILDVIARQQDAIHQEPKPQWVDRMSVYIDEHYTDENLGLSEVSAAFGITPSYATRVFKQYTGRGIYETIQHVRLSAAKALLFSDMTMKQIAQTVGYTSFLSMNRAFKKYEGTTLADSRSNESRIQRIFTYHTLFCGIVMTEIHYKERRKITMNKKLIIGGIAAATAAAAAAAAVAAAKKLKTEAESQAEEPICLDLDGDGVTDVILEDLDGDGKIDTVTADTSGDGKLDTILSDVDGDGEVDVVITENPEVLSEEIPTEEAAPSEEAAPAEETPAEEAPEASAEEIPAEETPEAPAE